MNFDYYFLFFIFLNCIDNSQKDYIPTEISVDQQEDGLDGLEYLKKQLYENNFKKGIISDDISEKELAIQREFSIRMLEIINMARERPQEFSMYLRMNKNEIINTITYCFTWSMSFNDTVSVNELDENFIGKRKDAARMYDGLVSFFEKLPPMEGLIYEEVLTKSAILHKNNMTKYGSFDHIIKMIGEDIPFTKVDNRCSYFDKNNHYNGCGENLSMAGAKYMNLSIEDVLLFYCIFQLMLDDGVVDKGHLKAITNPDFQYLGFAVGFTNSSLKKSAEPHNEKEKKYAEEGLLSDSVFLGPKIIGVMNFCSDISPIPVS